MKPNIITDGLPKEVVIDDGKYQINWDFRIGMKFDEIMESEAPDIVKLEKLLTLYYPKHPNNLEEAVERAITECIKEGILTKSSKNSPTSSGSEMNCKRNLNGSGGRREIGIPR